MAGVFRWSAAEQERLFQAYRATVNRDTPAWEIVPLGEDYDTLNAQVSRGISRRAERFLRDGKLGFVLLAGGVGSRLGHFAPKGTFPVGPISEKSLFQIHFEKLNVLRQDYDTPLRVYMMTSRATHGDTQKYLKECDYFGFPAEDVFFFTQGELPAIHPENGTLFTAPDGSVVCGPDGHGGLITALDSCGAYDSMRRFGIETVCTFHVDNPLVPLGHEGMLDLHLGRQSDMTSLAVDKASALERVGNLVHPRLHDPSVQVVEYMDFPEEYAHRTTPDGGLAFWAGSIGVHLIQVEFLREINRRIQQEPDFLPYHLPLKKIRTAAGYEMGIKPERFIFDTLPYARNPVVLRADRNEVFTTLKDDAEVVRTHLSTLYATWLRRAGSRIPENATVEIAPSFALYYQQLAENPRRRDIYDDPEIYLS